MSWDGRKMTKPIGMGDISKAVSYGSLDLGKLIANGTIRPMAKYKPVRRPEIGILNETQRASTRYGFGTISDSSLPQLPMSEAEPQNDWVYLRPQGIGNNNNEWYRALDFDGYVKDACPPLVVKAERIANDGKSVVMLYGDSITNGQRPDGKSWVANESLSLDELLASASDYTGYNIAFILCNGSTKNLIVTNVTAWSFIHEKNKVNGFYFYPSEYKESGVTYPAVPLLASSKSGDKVTVIVCLTAPSLAPTSTSPAYNVYTDVVSYTLYSLGFVSGCDRTSAPVTTTAFKMDGVDFSVSVRITNMVTEIQDGGQYWRAYSVNVNGSFNMSGANGWNPTDLEKTLSGSISISGGGFFFSSSPSDANKQSSITANTSVGLLPYANGQGKSIYGTGSDEYLWVLLKEAGGSPISSVTVTASVTMNEPLTTAITRTGSATI